MVSYSEYHMTRDYVIPVYEVRFFIKKNSNFLLVNSVYLYNVCGLSCIGIDF